MNINTNMLNNIHRTIFDPNYYLELKNRKFKSVFSFILPLIFIVSFFGAVLHFNRITDAERGLPAILPAIFSNVEFSYDGIEVASDKPYLVGSFLVNDFYTATSGTKMLYQPHRFSDSVLVIDGKNDEFPDSASSIGIVFKKSNILVNIGGGSFFPIPYSSFIKKGSTFFLTSKTVSEYFSKKILFYVLSLILSHFLILSINIMGSAFFLSIMAYFLRRKEKVPFLQITKLSIYASTPLIIEAIITSAVGVTYNAIWYVAAFFSVFALFRGLTAITTTESIKHKENKEIL